MKLLKNIFIMIVIIFGLTGCEYQFILRSSLLVFEMSKHKADYWYTGKKDISFCHAIEWGDTNKMGKMIKEGLDINTRGKDGMTFLIYAYLKLNKKSFEYLLEHGADPNIIMESNEKPEGWVNMNFSLSALTLATEDKYDTFYLKSCLEHGGNPNAVIYTKYSNDYIFGRHILYNAIVDAESLTNIKLLVEAGSDVNGLKKEPGTSTPLSQSIDIDRYDIAIYLLEKGADPEISKDSIIRYIYDHDLKLLTGMEKQKEYRKKVIKILEDKGLEFTAESYKKAEEEQTARDKRVLEEYKKKHKKDNSSD